MEEKGYKSTSEEDSQQIARRRLIKEGFRLEGVPGFYVNWQGNWDLNFYEGNRGYLCPVYTVRGSHSWDYVWITQREKINMYGCPVQTRKKAVVSAVW